MPDSLPTIPIPLLPGEPEPTVNLQTLLDESYNRARFDLAIDYRQPLKPALAEAVQTWVNQVLTTAPAAE